MSKNLKFYFTEAKRLLDEFNVKLLFDAPESEYMALIEEAAQYLDQALIKSIAAKDYKILMEDPWKYLAIYKAKSNNALNNKEYNNAVAFLLKICSVIKQAELDGYISTADEYIDKIAKPMVDLIPKVSVMELAENYEEITSQFCATNKNDISSIVEVSSYLQKKHSHQTAFVELTRAFAAKGVELDPEGIEIKSSYEVSTLESIKVIEDAAKNALKDKQYSNALAYFFKIYSVIKQAELDGYISKADEYIDKIAEPMIDLMTKVSPKKLVKNYEAITGRLLSKNDISSIVEVSFDLYKEYSHQTTAIELAREFAEKGVELYPEELELELSYAVSTALKSNFAINGAQEKNLINKATEIFRRLNEAAPKDVENAIKYLADNGIDLSNEVKSITEELESNTIKEDKIVSSKKYFLQGYDHYKNTEKLDNNSKIQYASLIRSNQDPTGNMDELPYMQAQIMRSECIAATNAFKKSIELDPNNINAYFYSAMAMFMKADDALAERYLDQGLAKLINTSHEDLDKSFQELPDSFLNSPESYLKIYISLSEKAFVKGNHVKSLSYLYKFLAASIKDNGDLISMDTDGMINNATKKYGMIEEYSMIEVINKAVPKFSVSHYLEIAGPLRTANSYSILSTASNKFFQYVYKPSDTKKYKESSNINDRKEVKKILSGESVIDCGNIAELYSNNKAEHDFHYAKQQNVVWNFMLECLEQLPYVKQNMLQYFLKEPKGLYKAKLEKTELQLESEAFECLQKYQKPLEERKPGNVALTFAKLGLKLDPNNFELQMQEAIAKALMSQVISDREAKELLDDVTEKFNKLKKFNLEDTENSLNALAERGIHFTLPSDSITDVGSMPVVSFSGFKEQFNNRPLIELEGKGERQPNNDHVQMNTADFSQTLSTGNALGLLDGSKTNNSFVNIPKVAICVLSAALGVFSVWFFSGPSNENEPNNENLDDGEPLQVFIGENDHGDNGVPIQGSIGWESQEDNGVPPV